MYNKNAIYFPVVRLKEGERNALISLPQAVTNRIAPRFVLPPPKEWDSETGHVLSQDEFIYASGRRIGKFWPLRVCYVEARFLFKEYGHDHSEIWLPRLFELARAANGLPIPVASLEEAVGPNSNAFKTAMPADMDVKLGLRVRFGDLTEDLKGRVTAVLHMLEITSRQCVVFLDFADADLSEPSIVAEFLGSAVQTLQEVGVWSRIVFQGTNYPEKNPATAGKITNIPRTEWQAWTQLIASDPDMLKHIAYGDYVADSAKFVFGGGGIPIRHLRYCDDENWIVARGLPDIPQAAAMQSVAKDILNSGAYMGRGFSSGDERIYQLANNPSGGGNAQIWREANTAHHITKVVSDLGKRYGFSLAPNVVEEESTQAVLELM